MSIMANVKDRRWRVALLRERVAFCKRCPSPKCKYRTNHKGRAASNLVSGNFICKEFRSEWPMVPSYIPYMVVSQVRNDQKGRKSQSLTPRAQARDGRRIKPCGNCSDKKQKLKWLM